MAKNRSRRLRKKLHLGEFQEIGFKVRWRFDDDTDIDAVDAMIDNWLNEVMLPHGLAFNGCGFLNWEGMVCLQKVGQCRDEHRALVNDWLVQQGMNNVEVSELFDIWSSQSEYRWIMSMKKIT